MAKAQKSMMVPEDLYRLIAHQERTTGVTFTRQAIAAFFQYFFSEPQGTESRWMEAVIAVENGEITVGEVPNWLAIQEGMRAKAELARVEEEIGPRECRGDSEHKHWSKILIKASEESHLWETVGTLADNPIDALLVFWKRLASGTMANEILMGVDIEKFKKREGEDVDELATDDD